jgi:LCP family protein required for cell wall assembly
VGRAYTGRMARRLTAGLLSLALPGAGQLYTGARARAAILLGLTAALAAAVAAIVVVRPFDLLDAAVRRETLVALLAANLLVLGVRLYAVVDAWRVGGAIRSAGAPAVVALVFLITLTVAPHAATAYYAVRGYETLVTVFADDEPRDVLPATGVFLSAGEPVRPRPLRGDPPRRGGTRPQDAKPTPFRGPAEVLAPYAPAAALVPSRASPYASVERPWVTLLLIGSDHGPERAGHRTDTMIVVGLERGTGRALAMGIPRNFVDVPLPAAAATELERFPRPLNALYQFGLEHPAVFPRADNPGATALKQTVSSLLGIRIDYYAFVDLDGFVDMVDALGGVRIHVKERLVDSVTRPAWGETKPRIDVHPGRTYHFTGRTALAYVRSRKTSSDYTRMGRQRCFLSALADQLDVRTVLRHFGALTTIARESVRTDIPLRSVPDLVRLVAAVDPELTVTETFGTAYIRNRRKSDGYPRPAVNRIRVTVRDAILFPPDELDDRRRISTAARAC